MSVHFTDKDKGWAALEKEIAQTKTGAHVVVGIFGEKASADHGGKSNVEVATAHEFGLVIDHPGGTAYIPGGPGERSVFVSNAAAEGKDLPRTKPHKIPIPERSFIRGTVDVHAKKIAAVAKKAARLILLGSKKGDMTKREALEMLGIYVQGLIRSRISAGISPPLKAATIRRKGSSKPLIDTGQLRASIDFAVRNVGESK